MNFAGRLTLAGIILVLFILGFGYYQWHHPWASPLPMYPCVGLVLLLGLFVYSAPRNHH